MLSVLIALILAGAAVGGHVLIVLFFYNRLYGMVRIKGEMPWLNSAATVGFVLPWVLFLLRHGWPHRLLTAELAWQDIDIRLRIYLVVCGGVFLLIVPLERLVRRLRPVPGAQLSNHSQVVDLSARLARGLRGPRAPWWLYYFPGNQVTQVEVVEKRLALARVPPAWTGLSIVQLTDVHVAGTLVPEYYHCLIDLVCEQNPDLVVLTGDLLDDARYMHACLDGLSRLRPRLGTYAIRGNHDSWAGAKGLAHQFQRTGVHLLDNRCCVLDVAGSPLAIIGLEYPHLGRPKDLDLSVIPEGAFRLLLTHSPDNIDWARQHGMDLMLCGHTHGGQIRLPLLGPVCIPSQYGCKYDGGLFQEDATLMYVSRGLGGDVPLRLRCRPELPKLMLHPGVERAPATPCPPMSAAAALMSVVSC